MSYQIVSLFSLFLDIFSSSRKLLISDCDIALIGEPVAEQMVAV